MVEFQPSKLATWVRFPSPARILLPITMLVRKVNVVVILFLLSIFINVNFVKAAQSSNSKMVGKVMEDEPSRSNITLRRHINIPQTCKKELKEYCPKSLYLTRKDRFECLSKKIDIFSSRCKYYVNRSKNFYAKCQTDIAVLCKKTSKNVGNIAIYEKNCSETLIKNYKKLSTECASYIIGYTGRNISTKTVVHNIMKSKNVKDIAKDAIFEEKKRKTTSKKKYKYNEKEEIVNDGNYTAEDIKDMKSMIWLSNGLSVSEYEMKQFRERYKDTLKDMDENERAQFQNRYFELKQAGK